MQKINPALDGVDHINVYSKGKTELGRFLTNFAHTPIETIDGHFESIEGYWYWLGIADSNPSRDDLRRLWGWRAKQRGRELRAGSEPIKVADFENRIRLAIRAKLEANPHVKDMQGTQLPLAHYYVYEDKVIDLNRKFGWLTRVWQEELNRVIGKELDCEEEDGDYCDPALGI